VCQSKRIAQEISVGIGIRTVDDDMAASEHVTSMTFEETRS